MIDFILQNNLVSKISEKKLLLDLRSSGRHWPSG